MLKIRMVEEEIAREYPKGEMRCPTHLSIGQEAVPAALGLCVNIKDLAISTHRGHAHYIGKGGNIKSMIAEIYKANGIQASQSVLLGVASPLVACNYFTCGVAEFSLLFHAVGAGAATGRRQLHAQERAGELWHRSAAHRHRHPGDGRWRRAHRGGDRHGAGGCGVSGAQSAGPGAQ